ncbi:secretin and TonB N-terminal domain-containing protein [Persephonella sp. IF05-L8]|uniref:secretin and TonB N-terminal domain-containing protein n=1 Tax=Persephonella sp. IF05-L8 TaxID=1158338 RepID=UPI0004959D90
MDKIFKIILGLLFVFQISCYHQQNYQVVKKNNMVKSSKTTPTAHEKKITKNFIPPPPIIKKPVIQKISPLEGKYFSFSANNAPLRTVLYAISKDTGMNLAISPDVNLSKVISANFNNTPAQTALDIITSLAGVYYEIKGNVIYIKATTTKTFHIPYIHTNSKYKADLGGDVLGSSAYRGGTTGTTTGGVPLTGTGRTTSTSTSNLSGRFSLQYETPEDINDYYQEIETTIRDILQINSTSQQNSLNSYTLNRFTGVLIVTATRDKMEKIENFIKILKKETKKQVLIEAKIIEVTLNNEFRYGIDWNLLMRNFLGTGASVNVVQSLALGTSYGQVLVTGKDFQSILNALASVGSIETLSNPRIRVLNGQTALISSGIVIPFWEKEINTVTGTAVTQQVNYIRTSILNGILLGVTPYIGDGEILMNIIPVSTRIEDVRQLIDNGQVVAEAPVLNIKEAGTVVKVKDGDLIIIGGLIGTEERKIESKVPGLGDIPGIGALFKRYETVKTKKELIIFLRPHIIKVH